MTQLGSKLSLWNIQDAEGYARRIVEQVLRSNGITHYDEWRKEDLIADAISALWYMSGLDRDLRPISNPQSNRYDPAIGTFRGYADFRLPGHVICELRRVEKRTRWKYHDRIVERPRPVFVSVDNDEGSGLESALGSGSLDTGKLASSFDFREALVRGVGSRARAAAKGGLRDAGRPPRRAA